MSRTHELAWAAGFFDGEGYVTIQERIHPKYTGYYLRVGINHVAIQPLIEIQKLFGGKIEKQSLHTIVGNRKQRHRWSLSTSAAAEMLQQLLPYLKNKQKVVALGLDFQKTIGAHGKQVSDEVQFQRKMLKELIQYTNSLD